jgi:1-acyl-sn-glycerol-3-phosphate acyltransferase
MILLRSLAFNAWFHGVTFAFSLWHTLFTRDRGAVVRAAQRWAALALGGLRLLCGIDWVVTGREHLPAGAALVAPMHQSAFDTMIWMLLLPDCVYVLKSELTRIPLFGTLLLRGGMISVDRTGGASAMRDLIRRAAAAAAAGRQILIFPEGTRLAPGAGGKLQPGVAAIAARTGLPIIPVVTDSGHHWGRRAFRKRPGTIRIVILPPLKSGLPRDELMARLELAYAQGYAALQRGQAVDNSVGSAPQNLSTQSSGLY